jgi:hypothetical protein
VLNNHFLNTFKVKMSLEVVTRQQYTFAADLSQIAALFTLNVKALNNPHEVNIVGVTFIPQNKKSRQMLVKIVVGTDDPNDSSRGGAGNPAAPNPLRTNDLQNAQFQQNLQCLGIKYKIDQVIQIMHVENQTGTPGLYRIYLSALFCAGIFIVAFYQGEPALVAGLVSCTCSDGSTSFDAETVSCFLQVPACDFIRAINILTALVLPLNESLLCVNANNISN